MLMLRNEFIQSKRPTIHQRYNPADRLVVER